MVGDCITTGCSQGLGWLNNRASINHSWLHQFGRLALPPGPARQNGSHAPFRYCLLLILAIYFWQEIRLLELWHISSHICNCLLRGPTCLPPPCLPPGLPRAQKQIRTSPHHSWTCPPVCRPSPSLFRPARCTLPPPTVPAFPAAPGLYSKIRKCYDIRAALHCFASLLWSPHLVHFLCLK